MQAFMMWRNELWETIGEIENFPFLLSRIKFVQAGCFERDYDKIFIKLFNRSRFTEKKKS